ncbi:hypothetical protein Enr13x_45020 [Stieleria neptunia]|uniref:Uncharacterized protein n=1 Tax=Stieleria neptunia TaxID=2527979 RepID=A0A518HV44_9BACT|nr:hypothetical protein Enr13x_45020 [Stieleria neptunia]
MPLASAAGPGCGKGAAGNLNYTPDGCHAVPIASVIVCRTLSVENELNLSTGAVVALVL